MDGTFETPVLQGLAAVGAVYLIIHVLSFVRLFLSLFVLPGASLSSFGPKGSWALVTGASDGIGKEYATQVAARGFNIILVSRTQLKLQKIAEELSDKYDIQTKIYAMDFAQDKASDYEQLGRMIAGHDISILINNVGQSHSVPVPFIETPKDELNDIVTINVFGTLRITQLVAPGMVERKRGLILTMASFGGLLPTPLLATYSGSKAFLQQWSSALAAEVAPSGVKVQLVQSYLVTSAMSKIRRSSMSIPTPKAFVKVVLGKIGRSGGAQGILGTSTPFWSHGIMHWAIATFAGTMNGTVIGINKTMHEGIRKRALRKAERDGKKAS